MHESRSLLAGARLRAAVSVLLVFSAAASLAACASSGEAGSSGGFMKTLLSGGKDDKPPDYTPEDFLPTGYCPPVEIRVGTGSLTVYDKGHDGDPASIRYQASIGKTARECHTAAGTLSIKLGIAGRVVGGPKGAPGSLTLPVRVAVVKQFQAPLASQLVTVPVSIAPPDLASDFTQVVDQISVPVGPDDRDLIIYVGFDEGAPAKPGKASKG
jgi:hypothetical protein